MGDGLLVTRLLDLGHRGATANSSPFWTFQTTAFTGLGGTELTGLALIPLRRDYRIQPPSLSQASDRQEVVAGALDISK